MALILVSVHEGVLHRAPGQSDERIGVFEEMQKATRNVISANPE